MLKLYDQNKTRLGHIVKYTDLRIESELSNGDKELSFTYCAMRGKDIRNEYYVETRTDRFVVKEVGESSDGYPTYHCQLDLEDLEADMLESFSALNSSLKDAANLALVGTGWRVDTDITKLRSVATLKVTPFTVLQKIKDAWMCEIRFDNINKIVYFREQFGGDKGVYLMRGLNLKKASLTSDTYDYYTRIIPIGKDGLRIDNDGKDYIENYQYSKKVRTFIWDDSSYEDAEALKEDAEKKLADMSKPKKSYSADVIDLAKQSAKYSLLSFGLGDTVHIIDEPTGIRDKQRIVKLTEYPQDPQKNTCELSNTTLTFEEQQARLEAAAAAFENITNKDGTVNGVYVHGVEADGIVGIETIINNSETVSNLNQQITDAKGSITLIDGELNVVKQKVGTLETTTLKATEADLKYATIKDLTVTNQTVHSIQGDYAEFKTTITQELSAQSGIIDSLSGDFLSYKEIVSQELTAAKGWMLEGSIGSAQISELNANKIKAGTLDTAVVNIAGSDGLLQIADNTLQISDANHTRVQIGKDASGDYTLAVWDKAGSLIFDALGATEHTIQRKIIRDSVVADDANIKGYKLDINSVVTSINGATTKISGTVVQVGDKSLNVALTEQTQTITEQGELLTDHAARIVANENELKLKVSNQTYQTDMQGLNSSLSKAESDISVLQEQIALKVSHTEIKEIIDEELGGNYTTISQMNSAITAAKNEINLSVSESYATKTEVDTVSGKVTSLETWKAEASQKITKEGIVATVGNYYAYETDLTAAEKRITATETVAEQTAEKFTWIVKSGTSESDFTITDRLAELTANYINLNGVINISGLSDDTLNAFTSGGMVVTEVASVSLTTEKGDILQTEKNEDIYAAEVSILNFSAPDGTDGWIYFYGSRIDVPKFVVNMYLDDFPAGSGYIIYRLNDTQYVIWMDGDMWKARPADGSGTTQIWNWKSNADAVIASYTKKADSTVTYELYGPAKGYQEIKMSAMVAGWAAGAVDEFTKINGGLIMTNTIVSESLATGSVTADKISANAITALQIAANAVTAEKIAANAVTTDKIAAKTIKSDKIDVTDLFAQDITASGIIRGVQIVGATGSFKGEVHSTSLTADYAIKMKTPSGAIGKMISTGESMEQPNALWVDMDGVFKEIQFRTEWSYFQNISAINLSELSDEHMKNIGYFDSEKYDEILMQIEPIEFRWYDGDKRRHTGIGARKTESLLYARGIADSGLVTTRKETKSIAYSELHAYTINSIQKNRKMIKKGRDEIAKLRSLYEASEAKISCMMRANEKKDEAIRILQQQVVRLQNEKIAQMRQV